MNVQQTMSYLRNLRFVADMRTAYDKYVGRYLARLVWRVRYSYADNPYPWQFAIIMVVAMLVFGIVFTIDTVENNARMAEAIKHPMPQKEFMYRAACGWTDCSQAQARFWLVTVTGQVEQAPEVHGDSLLVSFGSPTSPQVYDLFNVVYYLDSKGVAWPEEGDMITFTWMTYEQCNRSDQAVVYWAEEEQADAAALCLYVRGQ